MFRRMNLLRNNDIPSLWVSKDTSMLLLSGIECVKNKASTAGNGNKTGAMFIRSTFMRYVRIWIRHRIICFLDQRTRKKGLRQVKKN